MVPRTDQSSPTRDGRARLEGSKARRPAKSATLVQRLQLLLEAPKWKPTEQEREVMEAVWMQVKGACEKLKEETNATNQHINKMLLEMADRYYSSEE